MGPVIQAQDYSHLEGYLDGALIVGSFHILAGKDGRQVGFFRFLEVMEVCNSKLVFDSCEIR